MSRAVILVLDALGIGAMDDVPGTRPRDVGANTLRNVLRWREREGSGEPLTNLASMGLGRLIEHPAIPVMQDTGAIAVSSALGYPGADSFVAHQTMMGTDMTRLRLGSFVEPELRVAEALKEKGHTVRRARPEMPVLLVDECMVIGDNLEADPGLNYNVTGSLDLTDFRHIEGVAEVVRGLVSVSRVIAVGGLGLDAEGLHSKLRGGIGGVYGIDTPATGFYDREGLQVRHMGVNLDRSRQLPTLATQSGIPVSLVGKMSDLIDCPEAEHLPAVRTENVLEISERLLESASEGLIAINVQEMDLAGHRQDASRWAERLELADRGLGCILDRLDEDDLLIVLGDHGNDPTVGHEFHTREYVPILVGIIPIGWSYVGNEERRSTLADVGATAATVLGLSTDGLEAGEPILE